MMIALVSLMALFAFATPAHAEGGSNGNIGDVTVEVDADGNLSVGGGGFTEAGGDSTSVWTTLFTKYRGIIAGISGIGTITMILFFIMNFLKLGASAGNPNARRDAITGCLWTGIATVGLGSVTLFAGFFYNILA